MTSKLLKKGDVRAWEKKVTELNHNKNGHANWEFFWEGITTSFNVPIHTGPVCKYLTDTFQADNVKYTDPTVCSGKNYKNMLANFQDLTEMGPNKYGYGKRAEALKNHGNDGWIWLLWNSYTNSTEVALT
jgi:hypothetical protein